ncbi:MAG: aspartate aminotransferase family protein, partial [Actinobacteria bacterium]|nr:aspartate aminotransferase family protein [Actinomycetota bacterium]NIS31156.1 aspartate aminotransferase family protein [Actinomycetota bacterium]NIT95502.1 aspartate aminotransferase family protein [Actinomycetota bacterium]NIU19199.1 aspartate aminotransferase family protein [Actinomycetota bacterium]NIU66302.1 aspartate aminotransferase family protein [Actinomycetota bacterium]
LAGELAGRLRELGLTVLNEVEINQVLVRAEDDERTRRVLRAVQQSGEAWMSGTTWQDRSAIRISISSWATSRDDIDRTVHAFASALDDPTTATT